MDWVLSVMKKLCGDMPLTALVHTLHLGNTVNGFVA